MQVERSQVIISGAYDPGTGLPRRFTTIRSWHLWSYTPRSSTSSIRSRALDYSRSIRGGVVTLKERDKYFFDLDKPHFKGVAHVSFSIPIYMLWLSYVRVPEKSERGMVKGDFKAGKERLTERSQSASASATQKPPGNVQFRNELSWIEKTGRLDMHTVQPLLQWLSTPRSRALRNLRAIQIKR